jgi:hypothetical protein
MVRNGSSWIMTAISLLLVPRGGLRGSKDVAEERGFARVLLRRYEPLQLLEPVLYDDHVRRGAAGGVRLATADH